MIMIFVSFYGKKSAHTLKWKWLPWQSGFEKARTYDADLIICDVLMPGMTGFEVTKKLKQI